MDLKRREFLKALGVTATAGAMAACSSRPAEKLIPFLIPPEDVVPGVATYYATVCRECPAGCGMLVRTREGRAVKVEGNPLHPANSGKLCIRGQASLQGLYNPDRIRQPLKKVAPGKHQPISWDEAESLLAEKLRAVSGKTAFIGPLLTGSLERLVQSWCASLGAKTLFYEPIAYEEISEANRITFGEGAVPSYCLQDAMVLFSFGADFMETFLSPVEFSRSYIEKHALGGGGAFAHFSPRLSLTAANADEWIPIRPGSEAAVILSLVNIILQENSFPSSLRRDAGQIAGLVADYGPEKIGGQTGVPQGKLVKMARIFATNGPALALAGAGGAQAQIAANLLNYVTGNIGKTVQFGPNLAYGHLSPYSEFKDLVKDMGDGEVEALLVYEANPLYSLPQASGIKDALAKVPFLASFSSVMDETTSQADLILPSHTPLESWGDVIPREGVIGLAQATMTPVFQTKGFGDTLLSLAKKVGDKTAQNHPWETFYDYLRDVWKGYQKKASPRQDFEDFWRTALMQGGIWEKVPVKPVKLSSEVFKTKFDVPSGPDGLMLQVYLSSRYYDGRGANKPWLHEIPDPMTQVVWDSWIEVHPDTAKKLGIRENDLVKVVSSHGSLEVPALMSAGIHPEAVAIPMGLGHTALGEIAKDKGINPIILLAGDSNPLIQVTISPTAKKHDLISPQGGSFQEGRGIAQSVGYFELQKVLAPEKSEEPKAPPMYPPHEHPNHRWGMAVDLDRCTGCGACVAACYAENNVALVGREQIAKHRQMAWIWIERFFDTGDAVRFVLMLCQQCDNAPCEPVCPVFAAYHTPEGLNAQVYNRCVGTRYCANNCPYKVRRFNWFEPKWPQPLNWQLNPDVIPREKGVMEKCTFCVQRIAEGKDKAKDEGRKVRDGDIVPACAQTCPTNAIVFGDLKDPNSLVSRLKKDRRAYRVLENLNTEPAITYLKKVTGRLA